MVIEPEIIVRISSNIYNYPRTFQLDFVKKWGNILVIFILTSDSYNSMVSKKELLKKIEILLSTIFLVICSTLLRYFVSNRCRLLPFYTKNRLVTIRNQIMEDICTSNLFYFFPTVYCYLHYFRKNDSDFTALSYNVPVFKTESP